MTGLRNRRFLLESIDKDVSLILREHEGTSQAAGSDSANHLVFMMIDLDKYKSINDNYGHAAGDQVLIEVRDILEKACRSSETLVRWGGDEFLVVGRVAEPSNSHLLAERVRKMIEEHVFSVGEEDSVHVSCSIGFACFPFLPSKPRLLTWQQVLGVADRGLYVAKNTRRNAWVGIFSNETTSSNNLFRSILSYTQELILDNELDIMTSIPERDSLNWGAESGVIKLERPGAPHRRSAS